MSREERNLVISVIMNLEELNSELKIIENQISDLQNKREEIVRQIREFYDAQYLKRETTVEIGAIKSFEDLDDKITKYGFLPIKSLELLKGFGVYENADEKTRKRLIF